MKSMTKHLLLLVFVALTPFYGSSQNTLSFSDSKFEYSLRDGSETEVGLKNALCKDDSIVEIPQSVSYNGKTYAITFIGNRSFSRGTLYEVIIPNTIDSIGQRVFYNCENLSKAPLPNSIKTIGEYAFSYSGLNGKYVIPESVYKIYRDAFYQTNITDFEIKSPNIIIGTEAFYNPNSLVFSASNPESIILNSHICAKTTNLETLVIPKNLFISNNDSYGPFYKTPNLKNIIWNDSTTEIPQKLFKYCELDSIPPLPPLTKKIGAWAFAYNFISNIELPNSITEIGDYAFLGCNFTSFNVPNSIKILKSRTFQSCSNLKHVTLPDNLTIIENGAFHSCSSLDTIVIPAKVTNIGLEAFYNVSLECITCLNPIPPKCEYLAFVSFNNCTLYVPAGSEDAYRNDPIWGKFSSINPINSSSIDKIESDSNNIPIEFYNLQGVKVANPSNGIFIKVQGSKASKVYIK